MAAGIEPLPIPPPTAERARVREQLLGLHLPDRVCEAMLAAYDSATSGEDEQSD